MSSISCLRAFLILSLSVSASSSHARASPSISVGEIDVCQHAVCILADFLTRIQALPNNTPEATGSHPLVGFTHSPSVPEGKDPWEYWNCPLDTLLQQSEEAMKDLIRIGENGLLGIYHLFYYLVHKHGIAGVDRNTAGGRCTRAMENTQHTHYTHAREQGCRHWGGARCEWECEGEAAGKWLGPRKVSLNMLRRVRTQPEPKPTKQPLTLNTLSN